MIRDVIVEGKDVTEAVEKGAMELGVSVEDVEFEIISMPRRGFLGIKKYPAKVKVYVEEEDVVLPKAKPVREKKAVAVEKEHKKPTSDRPKPEPKPNVEKKKPAKPASEHTDKKPVAEKKEPKENENSYKKEKREERVVSHNFVEEEKEEKIEIEPTAEIKEKAEKSADFLNEVMNKMGYENVKASPVYYTDSVNLILSGEDSGAVIGYRGETLDALQYLSSLVANRGEGEYLRININSGNYREKREKTLINLAKRLARQAVKTGKSQRLEPMNPYERRVIHGAVAEVRGATSTSEGLDPNRYVVIASVTGEPSPEYAEKRRNRNYKNGGKSYNKGGKRPYNRDERKPRYEKPMRDEAKSIEKAEAVQGESAHKIDDSELIKNVTLGVPLVGGEKPAPKKTQKPAQPKKQIDGDLYGKINP